MNIWLKFLKIVRATSITKYEAICNSFSFILSACILKKGSKRGYQEYANIYDWKNVAFIENVTTLIYIQKMILF